MLARQPHFFFRLAQGRGHGRAVERFAAPAGKADLARMAAQVVRAHGQQDGQAVRPPHEGNEHGGAHGHGAGGEEILGNLGLPVRRFGQALAQPVRRHARGIQRRLAGDRIDGELFWIKCDGGHAACPIDNSE